MVSMDKHLGIFIPSGQTPTQLIRFLDQIMELKLPDGWTYNCVVFVNGDRPAYDKVYERYKDLPNQDDWFLIPPKISFLRSKYNHHFSRAVNIGFSLFNEAKYLLVTNDDVEMLDDWSMIRMIRELDERPDVATVTPISCFSDMKRAYWAGPVSPGPGAHRMDMHDAEMFVPWNNFAIIMFRMAAVRDVGPLRQDRVTIDQFHYYNSDYEWNQRANAKGWRHYLIPNLWLHKHRELEFEK